MSSNTIILPANAREITVNSAFKVGATEKGAMNGRVSSEWFSRPDDERFTSLSDLHAHTLRASQESHAETLDCRAIRVDATPDNPDRLGLSWEFNGQETATVPNHWSFGQLSALLGTPAGYLRQLPAPIAAINLQYALNNFREENVKAYVRQNGRTELRAMTSPSYGRVKDSDLVAAVMQLAGNGTGETRWKIPGVMNWGNGTYNPFVDPTKETTTLFASDRDVFLFLVDDTHPIEIGKLNDGSPDYVFRGFYCWNSEVGAKTVGLSAFYLRGVCQNRNLWGIEGFREFSFRHSSGAPQRFMREAWPALQSFSEQSTGKLIAGVNAAKTAVVADSDEKAGEFLHRQGFSKGQAGAIIKTVMREEGRPARSIWDMVQGITAVARTETHQDARLTLEKAAGKLLDKVAA